MCVPLVISDLRGNFIFGDRLGQSRRAWSVERTRGAAHRAPNAARVPVDPALGHWIGVGARRIGRGDAEELEAARWPQPLSELTVIEPTPMPFEACPNLRIEDDRKRDPHLER